MKKVVRKSSYLPEIITTVFKCEKCGCDEFERETEQLKHSHLEGFYNCKNCNMEHDYCSDSFIQTYQKIADIQLALF